MGLPYGSYYAKVGVIFALTFVDLMFNSTADHNDLRKGPSWFPLVIAALQLLIQLLNFLMLFMLLFGTYLFQVGLIGTLMSEFKAVLYVIPVYAAVFVAYFGLKVALLKGQDLGQDELWTKPEFVFLSILQKVVSLAYYLVLLSATIRLGQAKWYQRGPWVSQFASKPS